MLNDYIVTIDYKIEKDNDIEQMDQFLGDIADNHGGIRWGAGFGTQSRDISFQFITAMAQSNFIANLIELMANYSMPAEIQHIQPEVKRQ